MAKKKLAPLPEPEREIGRLVRKLWRTLGIAEGDFPTWVHTEALSRCAQACRDNAAAAPVASRVPPLMAQGDIRTRATVFGAHEATATPGTEAL